MTTVSATESIEIVALQNIDSVVPEFIRQSIINLGLQAHITYLSEIDYNNALSGLNLHGEIIIGQSNPDFPIFPSLPWMFDIPTYSNHFRRGDINFGNITNYEFNNLVQKSYNIPLYQLESFYEEFNRIYMKKALLSIPLFRETEPIHSQYSPDLQLLEYISEFTGNVVISDTSELVDDPILYFDSSFQPHPALAYQFIDGVIGYYDHDNNSETEDLYTHQFTFFLRDTIADELKEEIIAHENSYWDIILKHEYELFPEVEAISIESTVMENDTLHVFMDADNVRTDTLYKLATISLPGIGPFEEKNGTYHIRSDYYYPSEFDINNFYDTQLFHDHLLYWNKDLSKFASQYPVNRNEYYWKNRWNATIQLGISENKFEVIKDQVPYSIYFDLGNIWGLNIDNFDVRDAIAHAIDREELIKMFPNYVLADSPLPYNYPGTLLEYDMEYAKSMLTQEKPVVLFTMLTASISLMVRKFKK